MKSFQTILLIIFAFFIVGAVLIFSGVIGGGNSSTDKLIQQPAILWGTLPKEQITDVLQKAILAGDRFTISYVEKDERTFALDLVDALASGEGPDLILAPHTLLLKQADKLLPLPYSSFSERLYRDSFIEASEVLLEADYVTALPLYLDPLVMYWNRDMFTKAGIATAPHSWLEIQLLPERLTKRDGKGNITESAVALGGVSNINHFKDILSAQIMQTGNKIVAVDKLKDAEGAAQFNRRVVLSVDGGADSALRYFTEFANPSLSKYSWNSAKHNSLDEFIGGRLAVYFGKASDLPTIRERNMHLNFDVETLPQISDSPTRATYTDIYALGLLKNSKNADAAFAVAYRMSLGGSAATFSEALNLPPARRDLLSVPPTDPYLSVFYKSAVISKNWYDPDSVTTRNIFADMVESVMIGKSGAQAAISSADARLRSLLGI